MQPQVPVTPSPAKPQKTGLLLPLFLMVGPTATLIATVLLYTVILYVFNTLTPAPAGPELFAEKPVGITIMNIITYIIGALGVLTMLPCFVLGLIMLVRRIERRKQLTQ